MSKLALIFICFFIHLSCLSDQITDNREFKSFLDVLARVESGGNNKAFNKKENAIGIYQIRPAYFKDAQDFDNKLNKYTHNDCYNPEIAGAVVKAYMGRYCRGGNIEQMARCHNSGWNWKKKYNLTNKYYQKFVALSGK